MPKPSACWYLLQQSRWRQTEKGKRFQHDGSIYSMEPVGSVDACRGHCNAVDNWVYTNANCQHVTFTISTCHVSFTYYRVNIFILSPADQLGYRTAANRWERAMEKTVGFDKKWQILHTELYWGAENQRMWVWGTRISQLMSDMLSCLQHWWGLLPERPAKGLERPVTTGSCPSGHGVCYQGDLNLSLRCSVYVMHLILRRSLGLCRPPINHSWHAFGFLWLYYANLLIFLLLWGLIHFYVYLWFVGMDQFKAMRTFCDSIEQHLATSRETPASGMGQQERYPGCQLYISSVRLAAIHQSSQLDCLRCFIFCNTFHKMNLNVSFSFNFFYLRLT